jgi:hypothetical protein
MAKIPRTRERTATPAELEDDRQRWLRATTPPRTRESIAALRVGLTETQDMPALTMGELVAANDNGGAPS